MILLNGTELNFKTFPNGETLVDGEQLKKVKSSYNLMSFKYENDSDLIKLMFVKNYLDDCLDGGNNPIHLTVYYMPYSRMDRVEGNSVFTLKYVANFINSLNFTSVKVIEPHSDVTVALLNKSIAKYLSIDLLDWVVSAVGFDVNKDYLFFPDAGAAKRYSKVKGYKQLVGNKVRDFNTGKIKSLDVVGEVEETDFKAIIVDDLSSYGGTFVLSAKKLKSLGASNIYLLVGHAEESIYKGEIFKEDSLIDQVFTTNSIVSKEENEKIKIYNLEVLY